MVGGTGLEPVTPTVGILRNVHKLVKEPGRIGNHFQSFWSRGTQFDRNLFAGPVNGD
jgi:hypothetical protein